MFLVWGCEEWELCRLSILALPVDLFNHLHHQRDDRRRLVSTVATLLWDELERFNWIGWTWINNWIGWIRHYLLRLSIRRLILIIIRGSSRYTWIHATVDGFDVGRDLFPIHVWALVNIWLLHLFGGDYGCYLWLDLDDIQHLLFLCREIALPKRETQTTSGHWILQWNVK